MRTTTRRVLRREFGGCACAAATSVAQAGASLCVSLRGCGCMAALLLPAQAHVLVPPVPRGLMRRSRNREVRRRGAVCVARALRRMSCRCRCRSYRRGGGRLVKGRQESGVGHKPCHGLLRARVRVNMGVGRRGWQLLRALLVTSRCWRWCRRWWRCARKRLRGGDKRVRLRWGR